jgi:hypothetical protein
MNCRRFIRHLIEAEERAKIAVLNARRMLRHADGASQQARATASGQSRRASSGIGGKAGIPPLQHAGKPRSWPPLDHIIGVGKQTGTNDEVSHRDRKALKAYEGLFSG